MFVYELSGSGFESSCCHLNLRFRDCFEQGAPWYSGNCGVWIHSETRTWHDKNIQTFIDTADTSEIGGASSCIQVKVNILQICDSIFFDRKVKMSLIEKFFIDNTQKYLQFNWLRVIFYSTDYIPYFTLRIASLRIIIFYLFIYLFIYLLKCIFCWRFCWFTAWNSYIILRIIGYLKDIIILILLKKSQ